MSASIFWIGEFIVKSVTLPTNGFTIARSNVTLGLRGDCKTSRIYLRTQGQEFENLCKKMPGFRSFFSWNKTVNKLRFLKKIEFRILQRADDIARTHPASNTYLWCYLSSNTDSELPRKRTALYFWILTAFITTKASRK